MLLISIFSLLSCNKPHSSNSSEPSSAQHSEKETGFLTSLRYAFDHGYVTNDNLVTIASYLNNEIRPTIHMPIADEIAARIKATRAANLRNQRDMYGNAVLPHATASDVEIVGYYGNYSDSYAVMLTDIYHDHTEALWSETIDGVTFNYKNGNSIVVWRESDEVSPR
ncbi:MAG TPA: hypothetical protein VFD05_02580 [Bacilli bacterium]|nr:hypothetical protein [Bacilli bacterium]